MRLTFGRGLGLGALLGATILVSTSAVAGTGAGAPFNLGRTNTVKGTSTLVNKGSGAALTLKSRKAPLAVSNSKLVARLNSDQVDGYSANQLARLAALTDAKVGDVNVFSALDTTTVTAPTAGYVLVTATALGLSQGGCSGCSAHTHIRHVESDTISTNAIQAVAAAGQFVSTANTAVFPVSAGVNTFEIDGAAFPTASITYYDRTITALFVPWNGDGTSVPAPARAVAPRTGAPLGSGVHLTR